MKRFNKFFKDNFLNITLYFTLFGKRKPAPGPAGGNFLLENGFDFLLENDSYLLLEG